MLLLLRTFALLTSASDLQPRICNTNNACGSCMVAGKGFLVLKNELINIHVPFEKCPHITVLAGIVGHKRLMHTIIIPRKSFPSDYAQHLTEEYVIGVACSENGWIERSHKVRTSEPVPSRWLRRTYVCAQPEYVVGWLTATSFTCAMRCC